MKNILFPFLILAILAIGCTKNEDDDNSSNKDDDREQNQDYQNYIIIDGTKYELHTSDLTYLGQDSVEQDYFGYNYVVFAQGIQAATDVQDNEGNTVNTPLVNQLELHFYELPYDGGLIDRTYAFQPLPILRTFKHAIVYNNYGTLADNVGTEIEVTGGSISIKQTSGLTGEVSFELTGWPNIEISGYYSGFFHFSDASD